jgi:hypothetical protein
MQDMKIVKVLTNIASSRKRRYRCDQNMTKTPIGS